MFKKKKLKARKKNSKLIGIIGFISIFGVFFLSIAVVSQIGKGNFNIYKSISLSPLEQTLLSPEEKRELQIKEQQLIEAEKKKKEDSNKINILIIGRGGYGNDAPELTDSIILASINKEKNYISMLSIPRDLYVNFGDINRYGDVISGKINGLYVHYLAKLQDEEQAVKKLEEKITQITNEKIDYYVNLDFNGFEKLIDSLGGIQIDVPKTLVDHQYPNNFHGYQTFILRKGNWLLDGSTALKYVRSRKNTGGDFGRSERQQQVIESLKEKILTGGYIANASKIKKLYNIFKQYLSTDIDVITAIKIFAEIKLQKDTKVYSSGLNASCIKEDECKRGGYLYYPQRSYFSGQSVLLGESATNKDLDNFSSIQKYSEIIFNSPKLFEENYKISIFSKLDDKEVALSLKQELKKIGLEINVLEKIGNIPKPTKIVGTNTGKEDSKRLNLLEYNEAKKQKNTGEKGIQQNAINQEFNNSSTKIIINGVDNNSETLKYLKKYLNLGDIDIEVVVNGPKYARDPNTKIEILYTQRLNNLSE